MPSDLSSPRDPQGACGLGTFALSWGSTHSPHWTEGKRGSGRVWTAGVKVCGSGRETPGARGASRVLAGGGTRQVLCPEVLTARVPCHTRAQGPLDPILPVPQDTLRWDSPGGPGTPAMSLEEGPFRPRRGGQTGSTRHPPSTASAPSPPALHEGTTASFSPRTGPGDFPQGPAPRGRQLQPHLRLPPTVPARNVLLRHPWCESVRHQCGWKRARRGAEAWVPHAIARPRTRGPGTV